MDPTAFRYLQVSFLVFEPQAAAAAFYEDYHGSAMSQSETAVQELEVLGPGIPTSPMQCIAVRGETRGLTCLVLEEDLGIVGLVLYANGPAVETEYGTQTLFGFEVAGGERWHIKSFSDEAFHQAVTMLAAVFHRYANQTLGE
jgi:hypothetical protein